MKTYKKIVLAKFLVKKKGVKMKLIKEKLKAYLNKKNIKITPQNFLSFFTFFFTFIHIFNKK